jgi:hypothetical protein
MRSNQEKIGWLLSIEGILCILVDNEINQWWKLNLSEIQWLLSVMVHALSRERMACDGRKLKIGFEGSFCRGDSKGSGVDPMEVFFGYVDKHLGVCFV